MTLDTTTLAWDKMDGLLPAIVQHADTQQILMLGYMNRDALAQTIASQHVTFFSRSKNRLWTKGESSGYTLALVAIATDCDSDALLIRARPAGPTCHTGAVSCFGETSAAPLGFLGTLAQLIADRKRTLPEKSYTTSLFRGGLDHIAQKVGEEAVETVIAAKNPDAAAFLNEAADLLYHLMILAEARNTNLAAIVAVLRARHPAESFDAARNSP